jgi:hypothetical protein
LAKSIGEVLMAFHVAIIDKTIAEKGRMKVEHEVTDLCRWYQQLEDTQQQDALMMEGLQMEVQSL